MNFPVCTELGINQELILKPSDLKRKEVKFSNEENQSRAGKETMRLKDNRDKASAVDRAAAKLKEREQRQHNRIKQKKIQIYIGQTIIS